MKGHRLEVQLACKRMLLVGQLLKTRRSREEWKERIEVELGAFSRLSHTEWKKLEVDN